MRWWLVPLSLVIVGLASGFYVWRCDNKLTWTPERISRNLGSCFCTSHSEIQRDQCLCEAWRRCEFIGYPRSCAMTEIILGRVDICGAMPGTPRCQP